MSTVGRSRSVPVVLIGLASAAAALAAMWPSPARAQQGGDPNVQGQAEQAQVYYPEGAQPQAGQPAYDDQLDAQYPQQPGDGWQPPAEAAADPGAGAPLIPPNVEAPAYEATGGGYCYVGPHPVDTRVMPGESWDNTHGQHVRPYAPIDVRLFAYRDGCYYFTGDPRDFGYGGQTYAYYGAHPVLDVYGGGWCFMMGPHTHVWAPWSPYFQVVGSWNYWRGAYDPFFWSYWPYYSLYYRSYYPHYYGGGRFYRGGGWRVAPAIRATQVQAWRGSTLRSAPVFRGTPPMAGRGVVGPGSGVYRGGVAPGVRGYAAPVHPGFQGAQPGYRAPGSGFHPGPSSAPVYRGSAPSAPTFHPSAPSHPSFSAPRGGGFHGGGGGGHRR